MLVPLSNAPRDYSWGAIDLLAALEGRVPSGRPEAEIWFGDHPGSPAVVGDGTGRTLDAWLAAERPGTRLPYLLKLLAAASSLSIQAHPSRAQAEEGFAREDAMGVPREAGERNYRDDNHKPELIVALTERFVALAGVREPAETLRILEPLAGSPGVRALRDRLSAGDAAALRDTVLWLLSSEAAGAVGDILAAIAAARAASDDLGFAAGLADGFPGDPGVVVALLMNRVVLRRGEGLFVPAGVLHAYQEGLGVELMAASDNMLRGGLTPKHVDAVELGRVLDATPGAVAVLEPAVVAGGVDEYVTPVPDFALLRLRPTTGGTPIAAPVRGDAILLATAGEVVVEAGSARVTLRPGRAALVTADERSATVSGDGEAFLAQPGV